MRFSYPSPVNGFSIFCRTFNVDHFDAELSAYFRKKNTSSANSETYLTEAAFLVKVRYAIFKCTESDSGNVRQNKDELKACLQEGALKFKGAEMGRIYAKAYDSLEAYGFMSVRRTNSNAHVESVGMAVR